jgi:hypothetical protein
LSHCPATPPILAAELAIQFHVAGATASPRADSSVPSYLSDTLKRPPRG